MPFNGGFSTKHIRGALEGDYLFTWKRWEALSKVAYEGVALRAYQDLPIAALKKSNDPSYVESHDRYLHVLSTNNDLPSRTWSADDLWKEWERFLAENTQDLEDNIRDRMTELTGNGDAQPIVLLYGFPSFQKDKRTALQHHLWVFLYLKQYVNAIQLDNFECQLWIDDTFYHPEDVKFLQKVFTWEAERAGVILRPQIVKLHYMIEVLQNDNCSSTTVIIFNSENPMRQMVADIVHGRHIISAHPGETKCPKGIIDCPGGKEGEDKKCLMKNDRIPKAIICAPPERDQKAVDPRYAGDRNADIVSELLTKDEYNLATYTASKFAQEESGEWYCFYIAKHTGAATPAASTLGTPARTPGLSPLPPSRT